MNEVDAYLCVSAVRVDLPSCGIRGSVLQKLLVTNASVVELRCLVVLAVEAALRKRPLSKASAWSCTMGSAG